MRAHLMARLVLVCVLLCCLLSPEDFAVQARLPDSLPERPHGGVSMSESETPHGKVVDEEPTAPPVSHQVNRLPGVCRRIRRRRITVLCNMNQYCSASLGLRPGHLCRCPKGSKCSHFFLKSL